MLAKIKRSILFVAIFDIAAPWAVRRALRIRKQRCALARLT